CFSISRARRCALARCSTGGPSALPMGSRILGDSVTNKRASRSALTLGELVYDAIELGRGPDLPRHAVHIRRSQSRPAEGDVLCLLDRVSAGCDQQRVATAAGGILAAQLGSLDRVQVTRPRLLGQGIPVVLVAH